MFQLFTEEELEEMRKKAEERERREMIEEAEKHGENRGKEETASKMRKKGFDIQTIMELTGLSKERILTL